MNQEHVHMLEAAIDDGNNGDVCYINNNTIYRIVNVINGLAFTVDGTAIDLSKEDIRSFSLVMPVTDLFE